jgi:hypothetical protein
MQNLYQAQEDEEEANDDEKESEQRRARAAHTLRHHSRAQTNG